MSKAERRALGRYVRRIADLMGLGEWEIIVEGGPPKNDLHVAAASTLWGRKIGYVAFVDHFLAEWTVAEQKATVVHELLHLVWGQPQDLVRVNAAIVMPAKAHEMFQSAWFLAHELSVDALSTAIAPLFPDPPWAAP